MADQTQIVEFPLNAGQDEGTQIEVLPVGKLSALQNARFRRMGRLGKRNGYTALGQVNASNAAIGNGNGLVSCIGPEFVAVDDRFYQRNETNGYWSNPPIQVAGGALYGGRLAWRWPQFTPGATISPSQNRSPFQLYGSGGTIGTLLDSTGSFTYAQGFIFTSWTYWHIGQSAWVVQVDAIEPSTGKSVFWQEFPLSGANTDQQQVTLLSTGNGTVVLCADHFTAGAKDRLDIYLLSSIVTGFDPATFYSVNCLRSAVNYYLNSTNEILITYATAVAAQYHVGNWNTGTHAFTNDTTHVVGGGAVTFLSVFGTTGGTTWTSYTTTTPNVGVAEFDATMTLSGNNTAWNAAYTGEAGPVTFASRDATHAVGVFAVTGGIGCAVFASNGSVSDTLQFNNLTAISQPFTVSGQQFLWVRHDADAQLGVATLVNLPPASDFTTSVAGTQSPPIEATLDDEDIDAPLAAGVSGPTVPMPLSTPLGFITLLTPTVESVVTTGPTTRLVRKPLLVPVKHRSTGADVAASCVVPVVGKHFVAAAQPQMVDANGNVEAGFIQSPVVTFVGKLAGGNLTASSVYQHTVIFESVDSNGLLERSAPSTPIVTSLGVGETQIRLSIKSLELTKKTVRARVYRTLANGTQFYEVLTLDASPVQNLGGDFDFWDTAADAVVGSNGPLYTQLGSEMENSQFPACSFAMDDGQGLWVGGGFKPNVVQRSKPYLPHRSVEFVDDDAFRVTLPGPCTGMAWLDNRVFFTDEGIYVVGGDGPDVAGVGAFAPPARLPFNIGCINWRSVVAIDSGVVFQSARGMCLLPRGFAEPVPLDEVQDTLRSYPYITSSLLLNTDQRTVGVNGFAERTVQWTALSSATDAAAPGVVLVYDTARDAWSVDTFAADRPGAFMTNWNGQRMIAAMSSLVGANGASYWHPFRLQNTAFADSSLAISFLAKTGDMRLWGTFGHGVINRVGLLGILRSACTLSVTKTTDKGTRATTRGYTGISPDYVAGDDVYLEVALGSTEQRDVTFLRFQIAESSTVEGMAFIGFVVEADNKPQGFRLLAPGDRIT